MVHTHGSDERLAKVLKFVKAMPAPQRAELVESATNEALLRFAVTGVEKLATSPRLVEMGRRELLAGLEVEVLRRGPVSVAAIRKHLAALAILDDAVKGKAAADPAGSATAEPLFQSLSSRVRSLHRRLDAAEASSLDRDVVPTRLRIDKRVRSSEKIQHWVDLAEDYRAVEPRLAKVEAMPAPGGPVRGLPQRGVPEDGAPASLAKAAELRRTAEHITDPDLARAYEELARQAEAEARGTRP